MSNQETLLALTSELVTLHIGLHFPRERWKDLERGLKAAAKDYGFSHTESFTLWFVTYPITKKKLDMLTKHLTIGETYFFREIKSFDILKEHILPKLIQLRQNSGNKKIKIWSAACSTGEEPYSIAILLSKILYDIKSWHITILATDINPELLKKATEGVYGQWSFRSIPPGIKEKYFKQKPEGKFEIISPIKEMVEFHQYNLVKDEFLPGTSGVKEFDVIFCRNVLMYFNQDQAKKTIQRLYYSLAEGGYLFVSPSELSHILFAQFKTLSYNGIIVYKKDKKIPEKDSFYLPEPLPLKVPPKKEKKTPGYKPYQQSKINLYEEAQKLYIDGNYGEAAEKATTFLSEKPEDKNAPALLARIYADQGYLKKAYYWSVKAVEANKLKAEFYYLQAVILQEMNNIAECKQALRRCLYLEQNFVMAHFTLGVLYLHEENPSTAIKHFKSALILANKCEIQDVLPGSGGMTADRLRGIITTIMEGCKGA